MLSALGQALGINVTEFGKMCVVHTSHFAHLEFHKNYMDWCRFETFRNEKGIVVLQILKISYLCHSKWILSVTKVETLDVSTMHTPPNLATHIYQTNHSWLCYNCYT